MSNNCEKSGVATITKGVSERELMKSLINVIKKEGFLRVDQALADAAETALEFAPEMNDYDHGNLPTRIIQRFLYSLEHTEIEEDPDIQSSVLNRLEEIVAWAYVDVDQEGQQGEK